LNIGDRVRLELSSGSISVYPVSGRGRAVKEPQNNKKTWSSCTWTKTLPLKQTRPRLERACMAFVKNLFA
jgi:hypothetical protein